ncbi:uncharacterized protein [Dipodomys merriami]|uniref:uncharacterized protein isoform X3 n=1 Tax=Dipodomys merriami TaxID=94247 RepID=UPI003855DE93
MCSQVCKECTDLLQLLSLQALVFWMSVTKPIPISRRQMVFFPDLISSSSLGGPEEWNPGPHACKIMGMWFDASSTLWQSMRVNLLMELRAHERIYVPLSHFVLGLELWVWALFLSSSAQALTLELRNETLQVGLQILASKLSPRSVSCSILTFEG